jgi:hypothetical protein
VLRGLGTGQVGEVFVHSAQIYRRQPSLKKPENNVLVLLTWSSISSSVPQVLSIWAASDHGSNLRQRLVKDVQDSQTTEQLALTLVALLCHKRLLPYSSNDTTQSIKGCWLADFDALMRGKLLSNERAVVEHMIFSFLQGLNIFGDDYQDIRQLFATVLDVDALALEPSNRISVQYWIRRMERLAHEDALGALKHAESRPLCPWYNFWPALSAVVLSARYYLIILNPRFAAKLPVASTANIFFLLLCTRLVGLLPLLYGITSGPLSQVLCFMRGMIRTTNLRFTTKTTGSILRYLEPSLACKSLLFSTCGEFFALIKHAHVHYNAQQADRRFLLVFASLSSLKFIITCVLFFVD